MGQRSFLAAMLALAVTANPVPARAGGSAGIFIPDAMTFEGGRAFVRYSAANNPDGCGLASILALEMGSPAEADRAMALIMTAISANKTVSIWVDGCVGSPWNPSVPKIISVTYNR